MIGQPTVILEGGMASFSSNFSWIQNELAATTRVVAYDRAGLGWSDPAPEPHDAQQSARDLHAALQKAGIQATYVFAGHPYGGLVAGRDHAMVVTKLNRQVLESARTGQPLSEVVRAGD